MNKIIIANWKSNPKTLEEAQELFRAEVAAADRHLEVGTVICPPPAFLEELAKIDQRYLGAQDIDTPETLKSFGASHVLVGHSDRRYGLGETDEVINKKIKEVLEAGIVPVLLIGERNKEESIEDILSDQLTKDLTGLSSEQVSKILFAYEPVWAISTNPGGQADTPENALAAIRFINDFLTKNYKLKTINYLYGGSVNEKNVGDFLQHPEISGAIIGKASLDLNQFSKILKIVSNIN